MSSFPLQQPWAPQLPASPGQLSNHVAPGQPQTDGHLTPPSGLKSEPPAQEANIFARTALGLPTSSSKFVGMSASHAESIISPVTGLSLSVFGMQVDLATFVSDETEAKLSSTSWDNLFQSISQGYKHLPDQPPPLAQLPRSYEECLHYGKVYIQLINAFLPILDKADFLDLVSVICADE